MESLYYNLLTEWSDSMLSLQIREQGLPGLSGGILCPACARIHGRCGDAVYPLLYMAHSTGNKDYLDAAVRLQEWSENMSSPDGSWVNEPDSSWKAITVFGVISLGEALRHHGMILERPIYDRWLDRMKAGADYVYNTFAMDTGNINYPMSASAALTIAGMLLNDDAFIKRGREFAHSSLKYFSQNRLIFGEGHPQDGITPRGCRAVDLGYNVEESLGALALYAAITGDEEVMGTVRASMREHLEFMLPDGGWDNSWGSRSFKWTYWGSRTSDGCQTAYGILANQDRIFLEGAARNAMLLKTCTHNGILYGGPHYIQNNELPCIHHTFTHSKALAALLDYNNPEILETPYTALPREKAVGVREYPEISTWLVSTGPWRATVTAYDWEYMKEGHPSGGSISMLWHESLGPVLTGSLTEYRMIEPANMQRVKDKVSMPLTPRLELYLNGRYYRSANDFGASVRYGSQGDWISFHASGKLVDGDHESPAEGDINYSLDYLFSPDKIEIEVKSDFSKHSGTVFLHVPVISDKNEIIKRHDNNSIEILRGNKGIRVTSTSSLKIVECGNDRIFNHVPGFQAVPLFIRADGGSKIRIEAV